MAGNDTKNENKKKALDAAIAKLEKDFGKGTVMKLGDPAAQVAVGDNSDRISESGYRARYGRCAEGTNCGNLRTGVQW